MSGDAPVHHHQWSPASLGLGKASVEIVVDPVSVVGEGITVIEHHLVTRFLFLLFADADADADACGYCQGAKTQCAGDRFYRGFPGGKIHETVIRDSLEMTEINPLFIAL